MSENFDDFAKQNPKSVTSPAGTIEHRDAEDLARLYELKKKIDAKKTPFQRVGVIKINTFEE